MSSSRNAFPASSENEFLHVLDLPQLYTRPSYEELLGTLSLLELQPSSFSTPDREAQAAKINPDGIPRYLTLIVSSSLSWLSDVQRETIWDTASARLSERSGRNAMPSMTRSFHISDDLTIDLFEPSLTEDNLGLKTWTSSLLLAQRLPLLRAHLPTGCSRILELGSGTGLVGIAAGALWNVDVVLTDLPEIVENLQKNVDSNTHLLQDDDASLSVRPLDWSDEADSPHSESEKFSVIIAADPIYSSDHPRMLIDTVSRWIKRQDDARFIVELPLRAGYDKERKDLRDRLAQSGMELIEEDTEVGYDDWQGADGKPVEVECWWSVWKPTIGSEGQSSIMQNHDLH